MGLRGTEALRRTKHSGSDTDGVRVERNRGTVDITSVCACNLSALPVAAVGYAIFVY